MIDTISITIPEHRYIIEPRIQRIVRFEKGIKRVSYNPNKTQIAEYGYLPRMTEFVGLPRKEGLVTFLKIEFSIPKLIFGNNFDEVEDSDFENICNTLKDKLAYMGIRILNVENIQNADVSTIHYSKNIVLTDYTEPYMYIQELKKVNINKYLDINQTDYRNAGYAIKFHSNNFELIFYDKLKDLKKSKISEKKSIEKDNYCQLTLFDNNKQKTPFEVLRIEIRIGDRKKLKQVLTKYGFENKERTFCELFSKEISQKILTENIEELENRYSYKVENSKSFREIAIGLKLNNPNLSHSQFLKFLGGIALIEEIGVRGFRETTETFGGNQWYRFNKALKNIKQIEKNNVLTSLISKLQEFEKIKLEKYRGKIYH